MKPKKAMLLVGVILVLGLLSGVALANNGDHPRKEAARGTDQTSTDDSRSDPSELAEDRAEGPDIAITGDPLRTASDVALAVVLEKLGQNGRVSGTEIGDEESFYEVEITLADGRQVDVQLDESFVFVGFD